MSDLPDLQNEGAPSAQRYWISATRPRMALLAGKDPKSPSEEVASARQSIDDEIEAASLAICTMRSRRNDLSPIAVLPPEMLAQVFEFSTLMDPLKNGRNGSLGWIGVTHVCRAWRQVAFQYPRLWRNIVFTVGPTWANTYLARAKSTPICIKTPVDLPGRYVQGRYTECPFEWDAIRSHLWHTAKLELDGTRTSLDPVVRSLTLPTPKLRVLKLAVYPSSYRHPSRTRPFLPPNFLSHDAPSLRQISLKEISFSWTSLAFRTLSSLDITVSQGEDPDKTVTPHVHDNLPFSKLLSTLQVMTNLEKLALDGCIPTRSPAEELAPNTIEFTRLTSLTLAGPAEKCADVWRFLRISPLAILHLRCFFKLSTTEGVYDVLSLINAHLIAPERVDIPILTFDLSPDMMDPSRLSAVARRQSSSNKLSPDVFDFVEEPDVTLQLSPSAYPYQVCPDNVFQRTCEAFPLEHLQSLYLRAPDKYLAWTRKECWIDRFGQSKALEHVCVVNSVAYGFCEALADLADSSRPHDAVFLPALCYVSIVDVDFRTVHDTMPLHEALLHWLENRREVGAPLEYLDISDCTIEEEWAEKLEGIVHTMLWDRFRGDLASEEDEDEDEDYGRDSWDEEPEFDGTLDDLCAF